MDDVVVGIDATQLPPRAAWAFANGREFPSPVESGRSEFPQPACQSVPCCPPLADQVDSLLVDNFVRSFKEWSESHTPWFQRQSNWNIVRIGVAHPALLPERAISELSSRVSQSVSGRKAIPRLLLAAPLAIAIHELRNREAHTPVTGTLLACAPGLGCTKQGLEWWSHEWFLLRYERGAGQRGYWLHPQWFCSRVPKFEARTSVKESEWGRRLASLSPDVSIVSGSRAALESVSQLANGSQPGGQYLPDAVALGAASFAQFHTSAGQEQQEWKLMHPIPLPRGILGVSDREPLLHVWREVPTTSAVDAAEAVRVPLSHVSIAALHGLAEIDPPIPRWRVVEPSDPAADCPWIYHGLQRSDESRGISQDWHVVRLDRSHVSWSSQNISVTRHPGSAGPVI